MGVTIMEADSAEEALAICREHLRLETKPGHIECMGHQMPSDAYAVVDPLEIGVLLKPSGAHAINMRYGKLQTENKKNN